MAAFAAKELSDPLPGWAYFYDPQAMRPSQVGIDYLLPIFEDAIGADDLEVFRTDLFTANHLLMPYHSVNVAVNKRIRYLV